MLKNEAGIDLEALSLLTTFYSARKCYVDTGRKIN